jgi:hypothetical protein
MREDRWQERIPGKLRQRGRQLDRKVAFDSRRRALFVQNRFAGVGYPLRLYSTAAAKKKDALKSAEATVLK